MNPEGTFETSMVEPLVILFALAKIKIGQGFYKSGRSVGRPFMGTFIVISFILVIMTLTKR